jgi:hypothetical protein
MERVNFEEAPSDVTTDGWLKNKVERMPGIRIKVLKSAIQLKHLRV